MTTRFDKVRDNLRAAVDASLVSKLITEVEAFSFTEIIEDKIVEMESDEKVRRESL